MSSQGRAALPASQGGSHWRGGGWAEKSPSRALPAVASQPRHPSPGLPSPFQGPCSSNSSTGVAKGQVPLSLHCQQPAINIFWGRRLEGSQQFTTSREPPAWNENVSRILPRHSQTQGCSVPLPPTHTRTPHLGSSVPSLHGLPLPPLGASAQLLWPAAQTGTQGDGLTGSCQQAPFPGESCPPCA